MKVSLAILTTLCASLATAGVVITPVRQNQVVPAAQKVSGDCFFGVVTPQGCARSPCPAKPETDSPNPPSVPRFRPDLAVFQIPQSVTLPPLLCLSFCPQTPPCQRQPL
ncbi:hypothetical protein HER10_EVM0004596 [Colletotrichum scovillei]|uniref:uncharacterized protein n=1 Tax=Colletotrichum scovillei TaxID=1209932 RepID=UPI0015C37E48|nr:uncharacterized protein HER10_EVM0004596 [Colletotrichum scovillei]KAF4773789.1 hypothetical protein HER10_EVM0004596 [Colletotrichum scovillei]